jgi:glycoprotease/Kae1 family metallohydrolase
VAVANTPGLAGSLLVGLVAAKSLAVALDVPLVAVNHLQAHIYACRIAAGAEVFPCVGLIVSGGHTSLYRCRGPLDFELLGATIDDAAGEAFDKVAAMLGLPRAVAKAPKWATGNTLFHVVSARSPAARFQFQRIENGRALRHRPARRRSRRKHARATAKRRPVR